MDAPCKIQGSIHVFRLVNNMCPGKWVHIIKVGLFLFASLRLANPARAASSQGCRGIIYVSIRVRRSWEKQGSRRWRSETTTDSLHRFLPNVRFTKLRSREGKSTVRKQVGPPQRT